MTLIDVNMITGEGPWDIYTGTTSDFSAAVLRYEQQNIFPFTAGPFQPPMSLYFFFKKDDCDIIVVNENIVIPPTPTPTASVTATPTLTPTLTPSNTVTPTFTPSLTVSVTLSPSLTMTNTPTMTVTPSATLTPTVTPTYTRTPTPTPKIIRGIVTARATGTPIVGGQVYLEIVFDRPIPVDITYHAGYDMNSFDPTNYDTSNGYPAPRTHTEGTNHGFTDYPVSAVITAGTTNYSKPSVMSEVSQYYAACTKVVFYEVTIPGGWIIEFAPSTSALTIEIRE